MKISFYQQDIRESERQHTEKANKRQEAGRTQNVPAAGAAFDRSGGQRDAVAGRGEKGKSLIELQQEMGSVDVGVLQDYMTLMSNTMSAEDYAKMQEEGFDFSGMEPEEAVTIVDKIKAELARSGKNIEGYTDDLDMETLAAVLGSAVLAQAVADSFAQADIPLTEENVKAVAQAWAMGSSLQQVGDSAGYLIDNEMEPEIWNLYLAENSGAGQGGGSVAGFYEEDVRGYYAQQYTARQASAAGRGGEAAAEKGLQEQIDRIIEQSGREIDPESRELASWLLDRGLPLTKENLDRLEELRQIELPLTEESFAQAAANAVAEGKSPVHASLGKENRNLYEKAAELDEYYHGSEAWEKALGDITARRQLEEIRLRMTAEVNVKLLKSGFSIDTAPMEQLVEALKWAEEELAGQYFPGDDQAVEKYRLYQNVSTVTAELPGLPAAALGSFVAGQYGGVLPEGAGESAEITPEGLHSQGTVLRDSYERAQTSYEALMTAPRADLGDSIRKAFANVDDILQDLGLEPTEENRRAARILGYNRMEMTLENLETVREADRQVKAVLEKITPAATLKMIRDGVNPLETSFEELERYFETLPEDYKDEAQSYSRFLYGLEKNRKITEAERESYIGIYRLMRQIEKTDGAAVGALVNTHAQVQFANLLTAVRTGRVRSLDVRAADEMGGVIELARQGKSIPEQVARAFGENAAKVMTEVSYSEEAEREYNSRELETLRETAASADRECTAMLQRGELPQSADNLMAAQALLNGEENILVPPVRRRDRSAEAERGQTAEMETAAEAPRVGGGREEDGSGLWELLDEKAAFSESYTAAAETAMAAVEESTFEAGSSVDVRHMRLWHKQLHVASSLARQEEYFLPMYVGDRLTRVHLTMDRTGENRGSVAIDLKLEETRIHAQLRLEDGVVFGNFTAENQNEVMKLQKIADTFTREAGGSWTVGSISVAAAGSAGAESLEPSAQHTRTESSELYRVAKVFLQSVRVFSQSE